MEYQGEREAYIPPQQLQLLGVSAAPCGSSCIAEGLRWVDGSVEAAQVSKETICDRYHDDAIVDFLHDVNKVEHSLGRTTIVHQLALAPSESADGGWLLRDAATKQTFLLLVDATSVTGDVSVAGDSTRGCDNWRRADHWRHVSALAKSKVESGELKPVAGSAAEALAAGRYFYVYLGMNDGETEVSVDKVKVKASRGRKGDEIGEVEVRVGRAVRMEAAAVDSMMGPMKEMYRVLRRMTVTSDCR